MIVQYPTIHKWVKTLSPDIFADFGKSDTKKLNKTISEIQHTDFSYEIHDLDESQLDWFIPMYHARLQQRHNPAPYPVRESTLGNQKITHPFKILVLYEKTKPIGGTIFLDKPTEISLYYRTYDHAWGPDISLHAGPSLFTEYAISAYALEQQKETFVHGTDRNPYGIHSAIGVGIFKLSFGFYPHLPKKFETSSINLQAVTQDILVLEKPTSGTQITHAHLVTSEENEHKYTQLSKYTDQLAITTHYR